MPLVSAKCTNCGANLEVDNTKDAAVCPYCNTPYVIEKAVNYFNTTNHISADVVNVYGGNSAEFIIRAGELIKYNGAATEVYIPNTVKRIAGCVRGGNGAFSHCGCLTKVVIPDSVTEIGESAFYGCSSLTEVVIPNSVVKIERKAFECCGSLTEIVIPDSVTELGPYAFSGCTSLRNLILSKNLKLIPGGAFAWTHLDKVVIPDAVERIAAEAFGCSINSISIPDGVDANKDAFRRYYADADKEEWLADSIGQINASEEWKKKYYFVSKLLDSYKPSPAPEPVKTSGGCYIATAVYGSYDCPPVWTLRRFRDETLAKSFYGRAFIRCYYAISPTLVKCFGDNKWFIEVCRQVLDRIVDRLHSKGIKDDFYQDNEINGTNR